MKNLQSYDDFLNEGVVTKTSEFTKLLDDTILKFIKPYKSLELQWKGSWSDYSTGYGGSRNEWSRQLINKEGDDILSVKAGWSSGDHLGSDKIPTKENLFFHIYPKVHFNYGSIAVGGGISSENITKISDKDIDNLKNDIKSELLKKLSKK